MAQVRRCATSDWHVVLGRARERSDDDPERRAVFQGRPLRVEDSNRRVPVRERQIPALLIVTLERRLVGEDLLLHLAAVFGRGLVLVRDDDAIVVADVFAGAMATM